MPGAPETPIYSSDRIYLPFRSAGWLSYEH